MEEITEDPIISWKKKLSSVPVKILNCSSRDILSKNLDCKQFLTSKKNKCNRDYRGLGELVGLEHSQMKILEKSKESPTQLILDAWESQSDATLGKLIEYLEQMERYDVIQELIPSFKKAESQKVREIQPQDSAIQSPRASSSSGNTPSEREMQIYTLDDLKSGECTFYDAYVAYADEDCDFVQELASILESDLIGLKLFIRGRDLLAGFSEHETNIRLIKERCRRMLVILSPNFMNCPSCEFQASFASALAIDERKRIVIPMIYASCEIPVILTMVHKIDFTNSYTRKWMWEKLIISLQPEDKISMINSSLFEKILLPRIAPTSVPLPSVETNPMITFPSTSKHTPVVTDDPSASIVTTSKHTPTVTDEPSKSKNTAIIIDDDPSNVALSVKSDETVSQSLYKNGTTSSKISINTFIKFLKALGGSSKRSASVVDCTNHSVSSLSNATSGFHSHSRITSETACSGEVCTTDTPV